ncbi:MAG: phenylacetate-CoA oxygenase subunit PaaJ [Rhodobacteraceae bacterium]|nr:phenylacetate-CoA oxygenase subunit PaaJ [Paracoccaceae bacterium]
MRAPVDQVWAWLSELADPEIPVLTLTDLGVIRDVAWEGDTLAVTVTPTYSGCPATAAIEMDIAAALRARGIERLALRRQLSPPWTTAWITAAGRKKLRGYGIAPPVEGTAATGRVAALLGARLEVPCPRCGSPDTEEVSRFGSTPCKALWRCRACREPFDYFKCH